MTAREIVAWVVVGILIAFGGYVTYKSVSANGKVKTLSGELKACQNAPVKIRDSIRDTIIYCDRWHAPKPVPYPVYIDTVKPRWCQQDYSDNYKFVKGILVGNIHYFAHVRDCQLQILFDSVNLPIDYRIITKTVLKDTCSIKKPSWELDVTPRVAYNIFDNSFSLLGEGELSYKNFGLILELGLTTKKDIEANIGIGYTFPIK